MEALSFVPTADIINIFENVIDHDLIQMKENLDENMDEFVNYLVKTYLGNVLRNGRQGRPKIPLEMWNNVENVMSDVAITNNSIEASN